MKDNIALLFISLIIFTSCTKRDVSTQQQINTYSPIDSSISYFPNRLEFHWLRWTVDGDWHLLTADLIIPKPYEIQTISIVHAQNGLKAFDIPKYDSIFSPYVYYKADSVGITISASYGGSKLPERNEFEDENGYARALYLFGVNNLGIGIIKVYFNRHSYKSTDTATAGTLTYQLHWMPDSPHLLSATLAIPEGYSATTINNITVFGVDTVVVPKMVGTFFTAIHVCPGKF